LFKGYLIIYLGHFFYSCPTSTPLPTGRWCQCEESPSCDDPLATFGGADLLVCRIRYLALRLLEGVILNAWSQARCPHPVGREDRPWLRLPSRVETRGHLIKRELRICEIQERLVFAARSEHANRVSRRRCCGRYCRQMSTPPCTRLASK